MPEKKKTAKAAGKARTAKKAKEEPKKAAKAQKPLPKAEVKTEEKAAPKPAEKQVKPAPAPKKKEFRMDVKSIPAGASARTKVYSLEGKEIKEIDVPDVFRGEVDRGLIRRAVLSVESAGFQPKGIKPGAGRLYTATYIGSRLKPQMHRTINIEAARLPRKKNRKYITAGDVANVPRAVGGPKAHPPKVEKVLVERMNRKERRKAIKSAIGATAQKRIVAERGHLFREAVHFPIVVENRLESLAKTKEVVAFMKALGVYFDVERAKKRKRVRAGKGKMRGRKYQRAKSVLFVVANNEKIYRAARNIEGVDIVKAENLNAKLLAPGAMPGRLTVWSEAAIEKMKGL